jgi:hypothetical protein
MRSVARGPYCSIQAAQACSNRLIGRPEYNDTRGTRRIVPARVGEPEVQRDQDAVLAFAGI